MAFAMADADMDISEEDDVKWDFNTQYELMLGEALRIGRLRHQLLGRRQRVDRNIIRMNAGLIHTPVSLQRAAESAVFDE